MITAFFFLLVLLIREAVFRLGPPALATLLVVAIAGNANNAQRRRVLAISVFAAAILAWNWIITLNPSWTDGWYRDPP